MSSISLPKADKATRMALQKLASSLDWTSIPTFKNVKLTDLTANSLIYPSSTGLLTSLGVATNGQLPIGSTGTTPVLATLTGTTNQINIANAAGSITLSTPQNIHTAADPTFAGINLTSSADFTANAITFQPNANSTTFFQIKNAAGSIIPLNINTTNGVVNIQSTSTRGILNLRGYTGGVSGSAVAGHTETLVIGGEYNQSYNSGNAVLLHISDYSNDAGDNVYPIYIEDENNNVAFYINSGTAGDAGVAYFGTRMIFAKGPLQITGGGTPSNGIGIEIEWDGTQSDILSYDRNSNEYKPLRLRGSEITLITAKVATGRSAVKVDARLQVIGNSAPLSGVGFELGYDASDDGGNGAGNFLCYDRDASVYKMQILDASKYEFQISNTGKIYISTSGYLGIGEANPDAALEVVGNIHSSLDNNKLVLGTGSDAQIYYDGTNLVVNPKYVGTGIVSITGGAAIGDGGTTNYSLFETDGTLVFNGTATVWNDANVGSLVLTGPASTRPGTVTFYDEVGADTGIACLGFAVNEASSGAIEIPHDYKEGSDITFHVHWQGISAPTGTDYVKWQLKYTVSRAETTLDAVTTISVEDAFDTQYEFKLSNFTAITGTNFKIGDQFLFQLSRIAAAGDAYAGEALVATVGFHYECDTVGSRQISTK